MVGAEGFSTAEMLGLGAPCGERRAAGGWLVLVARVDSREAKASKCDWLNNGLCFCRLPKDAVHGGVLRKNKARAFSPCSTVDHAFLISPSCFSAMNPGFISKFRSIVR